MQIVWGPTNKNVRVSMAIEAYSLPKLNNTDVLIFKILDFNLKFCMQKVSISSRLSKTFLIIVLA